MVARETKELVDIRTNEVQDKLYTPDYNKENIDESISFDELLSATKEAANPFGVLSIEQNSSYKSTKDKIMDNTLGVLNLLFNSAGAEHQIDTDTDNNTTLYIDEDDASDASGEIRKSDYYIEN